MPEPPRAPDPAAELTPELAGRVRAHQQRISRRRRRIAVVGMSCRFPGGGSAAAFWRSLAAGRSAITAGREPAPGSAGWGGYLEEVDRLDAGFFRIAPVEAELMDPQQRLLLEVSWEALEDAGMDPGLEGRRGGVYAGIASGDFQRLLDGERSAYALSGGSFAAGPGRVAFTLGWTGPAIAVDTACSSSLVAIHQAMTALQRGEADLALAGGVNVLLDPSRIEALQAAGMLAPDGRCKAFDAAADGFVRGEGCGMLVLKRLGDAERDGDRILGVLLGSAVNQDGASAGLTVPNGPAQEAVIREALGKAGVPPATVDYLEAHGTGTELGDPIEVRAAAAVYGEGREADRPLLLGSVKTNVGHLESAAGVAGLMKVLLAFRHGRIPRQLHFETPNPRIEWDALPVRVTSEPARWPEVVGRPPRAAVSSFALFGTNAHLVLEGYGRPGEEAGAAVAVARPSGSGEDFAPARRETRVLPLAARSGKALRDLAGRYREWLDEARDGAPEEWSAARLADAAWTAGVGRSHFRVRAGLVFRNAGELREQLARLLAGDGEPEGPAPRKVAFLYTGQGSQWAGMGRELYEREPAARAVLDRCEAVFREERGASLLPVMFGRDEAGGDVDRTEWTQPALFALSAALTELWKGVGVVPEAVLGYSAGEIGAAFAAGAFGLEDGMRFASRRGALMGSLPAGGAMTAAFASPERVLALVEGAPGSGTGPGLSLAAENGTHCVVSGPESLLSFVEARLREDGIRTERLRTSHAFHSALLDPVLGELETAAEGLGGSVAGPVLVSNLTGRALGADDVLDGAYWRRQARSPVRFAEGVRSLAALGAGLLIEVGPRPVLGPLAALGWPDAAPGAAPAVIATLGGGTGFVEAVSEAYGAGARLDFRGLFAGERRRRVALPTYPFQRDRYWVRTREHRGSGAEHPLLGFRHELANGGVAFEAALGADHPGWLGEHRLFGRTVAPVSLYALQAAAAFRALAGKGAGPAGTPPVGDLRVERPLVLPAEDGERLVQFLVGPGSPERSGPEGRRFEVFSRGSANEPWVRHATGRLGPGPEEAPAERLDGERLRAELTPVPLDDRSRRLAARGVVRRPVLAGLWSGAAEALGEASLPPGPVRRDDGVERTALDAGFETLGALLDGPEEGEEDGALWLPVGWDRFWFRGAAGTRIWCRARLAGEGEGDGAREASGTRRAELQFYGPEGEALGGVRGLRLRQAGRSAVLRAADEVEDLLYEVVWRETAAAGGEGPVAADFVRRPEEAALSVPGFGELLAAEGLDLPGFAEWSRGLEEVSRSYALRALTELGWEPRAEERVELESLRRRLGVVSEHGGVLRRMLGLLEDGGVLAREGSGWRVTAGSGDGLPDGSGPPEEVFERALGRSPAGSLELGLLRRCGESLAEVLRGRAEALELLFGDEPGAASLYRKSPWLRTMNRMVAAAVSEAVSGLPGGRRLRVVEVGAGTGGTTEWVLGALPRGRTDYVYTDVSAGFFGEAEERFSKEGVRLEFRVLDIERDPVEQGFGAHGFDLVIAANVLHATRDLAQSLAHCRRLLAPSGLLVALEATEPRGWTDLTFGLLPGWWRFDDAYRDGHPLASPEVWRRAASEAGYGECRVLDSGALVGEAFGVLLARGPAAVRAEPGLWALGPGEGALAGALARELELRGQRVIAADGGSGWGRERWREFFAGLPAGVLTGVVHHKR